MTDCERVLKGLECCSQMSGYACRKCPYDSDCDDLNAGISHLASNALELVKEQQETIASLQCTIRKLNAALEKQAEQKHGHWKVVQDYYDDEHWQCSACGCEWYLEAGNPEENNMRYCPECGAKMDEEVKQNA